MLDLRTYVDATKAHSFVDSIDEIQQTRVGTVDLGKHDSTFGVGGNTFRALRNLPERPSVVYRDWARTVFDRITSPGEISDSADQQAFDTWHSDLAKTLDSFWVARQGVRLSVAHRYKLVDLNLKWISELVLPNTADTQTLVTYGHCALDSQTLCALNSHLSGMLPFTTVSMKDVHSEVTYSFCQELCREYCSIVGGTPLLFDYFVWKRGGPKSLEA